MLRPGSIEWGSKRSALEKFDYAAGDLALCHRHVGEWVGLMNVAHLQLSISDAALMASSDGAYGEVELRPSCKFADPRLRALCAAAQRRWLLASRAGGYFSILWSRRLPLHWSMVIQSRDVLGGGTGVD